VDATWLTSIIHLDIACSMWLALVLKYYIAIKMMMALSDKVLHCQGRIIGS